MAHLMSWSRSLRLLAVLALGMLAGPAAAQTCAIAAAHSDGVRINLLVHTTHVGPPQQMIATAHYPGGTASAAPYVMTNINEYSFSLPVASGAVWVGVTTGVGPSCATGTVTVAFGGTYATNSFGWADMVNYTQNGQSRCELRIATYAPISGWYLWGQWASTFTSASAYGTWYWKVWDGYGTCPNPMTFTIPGDPLGGVSYRVTTQYGAF